MCLFHQSLKCWSFLSAQFHLQGERICHLACLLPDIKSVLFWIQHFGSTCSIFLCKFERSDLRSESNLVSEWIFLFYFCSCFMRISSYCSRVRVAKNVVFSATIVAFLGLFKNNCISSKFKSLSKSGNFNKVANNIIIFSFVHHLLHYVILVVL